jgi:amino acid adenylation domain-containing protein
VHPKTAEEGCPALPLQQRMIFNGLRVPDAGIDVVQCVIRWPGLDVTAYRAAWERAVARHPVLRTGFVLAGDAEPVQVERPGATLDFAVRTDAVADFLVEDRARGFAFDAPPLVRVTVLSHATPIVVITMHHAVLDDRSLAMLMTELDSDYEGRPDFPERTHYRDFVEWFAARNATGGHAVEQDRVFWTEHLAGVSGATPLPFGKAADTAAGQASQLVRCTLNREETVALQRLADSASVTLNTVVLAAWALVLGTHAGTHDVVFGVTRSARHGSVPGADGIVGMLLATIPMRVGVEKSLSVGEWLREIRRGAVAVRDHQLAPLGDIERYTGASNLLSSLVLFERQDLHTLLCGQNPAWHEREVEFHWRLSYPLTLHAFAEPTLHITLIHDRFTAAEADVLAGHLRTALLRLARSPHGKVGDLSLLSPAEHTMLTSGGHADPLAYPRERTIPDLFDMQVRRAPDADAVFDGERWLTYAELDDRATRIAAALRDRGIGVEEPVAVALPRGVALIAAFLGVLKAGAAYLPVDDAHPPARNAMMLADSGARVIIADGGDWPVDVMSVDDLPAATPFPCPARADTLAYLNYTSGSTGRPKGVAVPHRGVVRLVHEPNFATVGPGQTFLFASSPSFDATTLELWGALLTGARVVPTPPGPTDAADLAKMVDRHRVSFLWLTAGLFHQLVEHDMTALSEVDQLFAGGDVLAPDAVRAALAARGGKPVVNGYGPTENTTFTSCHVMHDASDVGATTPIGRPVQHSTVYVLDGELRPVPVGAVGELYTGGDGVARGYLNRPALTAVKFVPDPFGPPGVRLYRTGDRARWRPDGTLEFLGRLDNQVKVRGFLVEPGETESVLRTHPQVVDAAVVVRGSDEMRRLVAYVTPEELDLASVRAHVAAALPEFLRPSSYQVLSRLPLNANGKIDRAALPEPVAAAGSAHLPLTGDAQHRMAGIWRALLGVEEVGAGDEFFELGGNSLLAMRLTFRIRETFGVELPIRDIYRAATLADLVDAVASAKKPATAGIVRRDRRAYRAPNRLPAHLAGTESADAPDRHWALWRSVELRGTGFGIEPLLALASPECAAAAARVVAAEQEFAVHRGAVLDGIKASLTTAPASEKPTLRRGSKLICKGRLSELDAKILVRPHASALVDAAAAVEAARAEYTAAFAAAADRVAAGLRAVAGDARFREAVAWQNPRALRTAVDSLTRPKRNSQYRQRAALVMSYLQRYTTTNDTIGFFGPVGWARITETAEALAVRPGPELLARRTVYLENWAVHELAQALSTPDTLRWATPRRMPFVGIDGDALHLPLQPPVTLSPAEAAVLRAVDGVRTAKEIAEALSSTIPDESPIRSAEGSPDFHATSGKGLSPAAADADPSESPIRSVGGSPDFHAISGEEMSPAAADANPGESPIHTTKGAPGFHATSEKSLSLAAAGAKPSESPIHAVEGAPVFHATSGEALSPAAADASPGESPIRMLKGSPGFHATSGEEVSLATADADPGESPIRSTGGTPDFHFTSGKELGPAAADARSGESPIRSVGGSPGFYGTSGGRQFSVSEVYRVLGKLRDDKRIAWGFEVSPAELVPERALRVQFERIDDPAVRSRVLSVLGELERGRDSVAEAVGDPDRLVGAMAALQESFTRHAGASAVRRPGRFYAGRTLVREQCLRDLDVSVGTDLIASLMPPLSLLLESARWFTSAGAAVFRRALGDTFRARVDGSGVMRFADFWLWANDIIFRLDSRVVGRLTAALQERWADILLLDMGRSRVSLSAGSLRDKVSAAFGAPRPGWRSAVQHSPDVMIAAAGLDAVRRGDFQWVLGELHAGPRTVLAPIREEGGTPQRLADALVRPSDIRVVSAHDACGPDLVDAFLVSDLLLSDVDGKLVVHDRAGGNRMDLLEVLNEQLMGQLVQQFRPLPSVPHTPRVSIDKLVVNRESWRFSTADLGFAFGVDGAMRFLRAQEWRRATKIPRFVFVKSPVEFKPFYVDLESLPSVEHFAHAVRALDREEPGGVMGVAEMLPGPDELWLTDAAGARYTAEFRFVAVDRRGPAPEGQS